MYTVISVSSGYATCCNQKTRHLSQHNLCSNLTVIIICFLDVLLHFNMSNYLFLTILACFIICFGKNNQVLGEDVDVQQQTGSLNQPEVVPDAVEIDPNTNLPVDWTPAEDDSWLPEEIDIKNETLDELLNDLANIETEIRDDPIHNAENLTRDLVEECNRLNISLTVLDPTSPEFNPETDWNIVDILSEAISKFIIFDLVLLPCYRLITPNTEHSVSAS